MVYQVRIPVSETVSQAVDLQKFEGLGRVYNGCFQFPMTCNGESQQFKDSNIPQPYSDLGYKITVSLHASKTSTGMQSPNNTPDETEACCAGQQELKDVNTYCRDYDTAVEQMESLVLYKEDSVTSNIDNSEATDIPMVYLPATPRLMSQDFNNRLIIYEKDLKKTLMSEMEMTDFPTMRFVSEADETLMRDSMGNLAARPRIMTLDSQNYFILYESEIKEVLFEERGVMNLPTIVFVSEVEEALMLDLTSDSDD